MYRCMWGIVLINILGILLMCTLPFLEKNFSRIEKVMTVFSISDKMFLKIESLMCALRAHINRTHILVPQTKIPVARPSNNC